MSITNTIILTNYTTITNIITAIPANNWEKASAISTIIIPVVLAVWAWYSEKRKDERNQQRLNLEKSQEVEKQKQLSDLAKIKQFIDDYLIPSAKRFVDSQGEESFQRLHYLRKLLETWKNLLNMSQNTIYVYRIQIEFNKAYQELSQYHVKLAASSHSTWIPDCIYEIDKLHDWINGL
ncbi:MAG: hypothetical protein ATN35_01625 [Epulopiscium sp. Nele67-Bin004]|nr:MAG: hypothetical protein ATN35_01625 [Epulopiscium sp. Nele67-Bin004]